MSWTQLLFSFKGRIQRLYWWLTSLVVGVVTGMTTSTLDFVAQSYGIGMVDPETQQFEPTGPIAVALFAVAIVNLWVNFALTVKRLHDRDRTGWWLVLQTLLLIVAIALFVVAFAVPEEQSTPWFVVASVAGVIALGVTLWLFVEIGFLRGTQGPNRFGPDPLGATKPDAAL
jgi:uncharacterized membrane protein YhaH (DUF805 family)